MPALIHYFILYKSNSSGNLRIVHMRRWLELIKTRWNWRLQLIIAIAVFIPIIPIDSSLRLSVSPTLYAIIRLAYVLLVAAFIYYGLGSLKVRNQKFRRTPLLITTLTICCLPVFLFVSPLQIFGVLRSPKAVSAICLAFSGGILEEFVFRGLVFSLFQKIFVNSRWPLTFAGILSSVCFGLFHSVNLLNGQTIEATLQQIFYATCIGLFFVVVRVSTNTLMWSALLHSLFDTQLSIGSSAGSSPWIWLFLAYVPILLVGLVGLIAMDSNLKRNQPIVKLT